MEILTKLLEEVAAACKALDIEPLSGAVIGTLDERDLNAFNASFFGSTSLIVLQRDLMRFVHLLMKAVCLSTITTPGPTEMRFGRKPDPEQLAEGITLFRDLVSGIRNKEGTRLIPPKVTKRRWLIRVTTQLVHSIELFIVAHEYAHLLLDRGIKPLGADPGTFSDDPEHEADLFGMLVVLHGANPKEPVFHALAPLVFFRMIELMEADALFPAPTNHPRSSARLQLLIELLAGFAATEPKPKIKEILELWKIWSRAIEGSWQMTKS